MARVLRVVCLVLLVVLAVGGWVGGVSFLADPSGGGLGMTPETLPEWPLLADYTVPGAALIACFGLGAPIAAVLLLRSRRIGWGAAAAAGLVLVLWMVVQLLAIGLILPPMQLGFLAVGVALIALAVSGERVGAARS